MKIQINWNIFSKKFLQNFLERKVWTAINIFSKNFEDPPKKYYGFDNDSL